MRRLLAIGLLFLLVSYGYADEEEDEVAGPIVKLTRNRKTGKVKAVQVSDQPAPPPAAPPSTSTKTEVGQVLEHKLAQEFTESTKAKNVNASELATELASTAAGEEAQVKVETVVRISAKDHDAEPTGNGTAADGKSSEKEAEQASSVSSVLQSNTEQQVDRAVASDGAEFVLSKPSDGDISTLTLDPQLITDLTCLLTSASAMGMAAEALSMPTMNGYLVAGAVVGPGGLQLIKELVQVETLAQLGVSLLLFGLGMELSPARLRATWGVAVVGGALQVGLAMGLGAAVSALLLGAPASAGAFVGSLLAMSSTSIVVKCLEATRSTNSLFGQITIGTLITQDCLVGLLFALAPVFKPAQRHMSGREAVEQKGAVVLLVVVVLLKLALTLLLAWLVARTLLRAGVRLMRRSASRELQQLLLCGWCFLCAWLSGRAGLSSELGAFLGGSMVAVSGSGGFGGEAASKRSNGDTHSGVHTGASANGGTQSDAIQRMGSDSKPASHANGAAHSGGHGAHAGLAPEVVALRESIDSVSNIMACLFLSSIGLLLAPRFLWRHIHILTLGQVCLVVTKGVLVGGVVRAYGTSWRTALAVGVSMAHVGEFAFILLSMGWQLGIVSPQVYELLLGITALSLLTTPLIILTCARLLRVNSDHHHGYHSGGAAVQRGDSWERGPLVQYGSPKAAGLGRKSADGLQA